MGSNINEPKFKIGDKVQVINYGHQWYVTKSVFPDELGDYPEGVEPPQPPPGICLGEYQRCFWIMDEIPELVGQQGTVRQVDRDERSGQHKYDIEGIRYKAGWYNEGQLQSI